MNNKLEDDSIQFPHLISEIFTTFGFDEDEMEALAEDMGLSVEELNELIDRAQDKWNKIKSSLVNTYQITEELSIPEECSKRNMDLTFSEVSKRGYRVIGGDQGDIKFYGYTVEDGRTILNNPELFSGLRLTQDEANDIAQSILMFSYESIGTDCVM